MSDTSFLPDHDHLQRSEAHSRAVARDWAASAGYRRLVALFADGDARDAEQIADRAEGLFATPDWLGVLLGPLIDALRDDRWFQPPLRVSQAGGRIGAVLFQSPAVTVTASVTAPGQRPQNLSQDAVVVMPGRLAVTYCHSAGGARWARFEAGPADRDVSVRSAPLCMPAGETMLANGGIYRHDGRTGGQVLLGGAGSVVLVTAMIALQSGFFVRDYATATGRLLRLTALDDAAARSQLLLAFLARANRPEAQAALAEMSHDAAFFVRWAAMQQWLAIDAGAAIGRLHQMAAGDAHPEIRAAAAAMVPLAEAHLACHA